MHRHCAELGVAVIVNHRIIRHVALLYIAGAWALVSTELRGNIHEGCHMHIDRHEVHEAIEYVEELIQTWRDAGHEVVRMRRAPIPAPDQA